MINLSKRLLAVASYVRSDAKMVDIGCDHALLDIFLAEQYSDIKIIAADVRPGALAQARRNVEKYGMESVIELRLGDGLTIVNKEEVDTVVISGLGGPKIIEILSKDNSKLINTRDIIVQTNTDHYDLRKEICKLGFKIASEVLVKENDIIYLVVHFEKGTHEYTLDDYLFGPILRYEKSELYKELLTNDIKKKEILYNLIPQEYTLKKETIKADILRLKKALK